MPQQRRLRNDARLRFGSFELDLRRRRLLRDGQVVCLGGRAFDVLQVLAERADRVVTAQELLDLVWGSAAVEPSNVQVQVCVLRRVLGPQTIVTVPRKGYRLASLVQRGAGAAIAPPFMADAGGVLAGPPGLVTLVSTSQARAEQHARALMRAGLGRVRGGVWWLHWSADLAVEPFERRLTELARREALLVLSVRSAASATVGPVLARALCTTPGLRVLALAAAPLGVSGERVVAWSMPCHEEAVAATHPLRWTAAAG
jgi:DNA-binding winged helix-turn-helix (wHTH) protein